jgi:hypothetical protein
MLIPLDQTNWTLLPDDTFYDNRCGLKVSLGKYTNISPSVCVDLHDGESSCLYIGNNVTINDGVIIGSNTVIKDNVRIDAKTKIGTQCHIDGGVSIGPLCNIGDFATIRSSAIRQCVVIGKHAVLEAYSSIGDNSSIYDECHISPCVNIVPNAIIPRTPIYIKDHHYWLGWCGQDFIGCDDGVYSYQDWINNKQFAMQDNWELTTEEKILFQKQLMLVIDWIRTFHK